MRTKAVERRWFLLLKTEVQISCPQIVMSETNPSGICITWQSPLRLQQRKQGIVHHPHMLSPVDTTHCCHSTCIISNKHAKLASYTIVRGQKLPSFSNENLLEMYSSHVRDLLKTPWHIKSSEKILPSQKCMCQWRSPPVQPTEKTKKLQISTSPLSYCLVQKNVSLLILQQKCGDACLMEKTNTLYMLGTTLKL
jgi:hypothetical protein